MRFLKPTYFFLTLILIVACKQTKYVPEGKFLLKKNEIKVVGDKLDKYDLNDIIRQQPNYKSLGIKWKLMAYNAIDSAKVASKRLEMNKKLKAKNRDRLAKEDRINAKRIDRAVSKGDEFYNHKTVKLKDTIEPRRFFREWYKYKIGHPPVVFDSISFNKTLTQFNAYLNKKGYYFGSAAGFVDYRENRKCVVNYALETGPRFFIDSFYTVTKDQEVSDYFDQYVTSQNDHPLLNQPFDIDLLDDLRNDFSRYMRDSSYYGFSATNIKFEVDTNVTTMKVIIGVQINDRVFVDPENKDSVILIKQQKREITELTYHMIDTSFIQGSFTDSLQKRGLSLYNGQFIRTLDTAYYYARHKEEGKSFHDAVIMYNHKLYVKPKVLEMYNQLEKQRPYSERLVEATYNGFLRMGLFSAVKIELQESESFDSLNAHYYLAPVKKQSFGFEPRATNSNGFLGVSASINYTNRNLFRGAEKLTVSFSGGFESQPPVFDENVNGEKIKTADRSFNTFEIGPSLKLELPGLFPFRFSTISNRFRPNTIFSSAYNFQSRDDFKRGTFQMNYSWRIILGKTQALQLGFPGLSAIKLIDIDKSADFESKLLALNDLFLLDAYRNQFIWQDWRLFYEYNNKNKQSRIKNLGLYFSASFDPAGNVLSLFQDYQDTLENGSHTIYGLQYSQFIRIDNELIISRPFTRERSLNGKLMVGGGLPYGNTTKTLPYDYSFFGGGANDNRGWRARSLGPGSYKYYLDTNRTATQLGDLRLGASFEVRFPISQLFKGAYFIDAGNIWSIFEDENRPGGQFSSNWYNEIAVAMGVGLRLDFKYFVIRTDLGFPIRNPALPSTSRWIWQSRQAYYDEAEAFFGADFKSLIPLPFIPQLHFGIGYPF